MRNTMRRFVLAAAFGFLASGAAKAGIVLEYTSANTDSSAGYTLGWSFTTTQAVSVTALDVWSGSSIGGQTSFNVRLYNSAGTTLRSATVLNTDPIEGAPTTFYTHAVTPLALAASTTYYIAMDEDPTFTNATFVQEGASGLTTNSGITYGMQWPHLVLAPTRRASSSPILQTPLGSAQISTLPASPNRAA